MGEVEAIRGRFLTRAGDVLLSAALLTYTTSLPPETRVAVGASWARAIADDPLIRCSWHDDLGSWADVLQLTVGDRLEIQGWIGQHALPSDRGSVDNALAVRSASLRRRFPLMIDPQQQATPWLLRCEKEAGIRSWASTELYTDRTGCPSPGVVDLISCAERGACCPGVPHVPAVEGAVRRLAWPLPDSATAPLTLPLTHKAYPCLCTSPTPAQAFWTRF